MSIKNREVPFTVVSQGDEHEPFAGIRELGFNERGAFVIDAWTTPPPKPRGSYFSSLPISPMAYRLTHAQGGCGYARGPAGITLWDDWGHAHTILAGPDVLDVLEAECDEQAMPKRREEG